MSRQALAAVAQTTAVFGIDDWTTVDLSTVGPNLTDSQPGADLDSVMIENKFTSTGSAYVVFRDDPGVGVAASDGWEIEPGGVLGESAIRKLRFLSFRATDGAGTVKVMIRANKTAQQTPWDS
jgi:hypothetical protein